MTPSLLLELFEEASASVAAAVATIRAPDRRGRTNRPGQYALDLVADAAAVSVLSRAGAAILSEESGWTGVQGTGLSLVLDPVDGSTNCARGIPYWGTSLCAVDDDGPVVALVSNHATGQRSTAVRGQGAWRDGDRLVAGQVERVEDALVALSGQPARFLPWKQFRALGSIALSLCDVAAGSIEGVVDGYSQHAPWDYLGGALICAEAGAVVVDAAGRSLHEVGESVRRQLLAAATPALLDDLRSALR